MDEPARRSYRSSAPRFMGKLFLLTHIWIEMLSKVMGFAGGAVKVRGGLAEFVASVGGCRSRPFEQAGDLLLGHGPEDARRFDCLIQNGRAVDAGNQHRNRQAEAVTEAFQGLLGMALEDKVPVSAIRRISCRREVSICRRNARKQRLREMARDRVCRLEPFQRCSLRYNQCLCGFGTWPRQPRRGA